MYTPSLDWTAAAGEVHHLYTSLTKDASRDNLNTLWTPARQEAFLSFMAYALTSARTADVPEDPASLPSWSVLPVAMAALDAEGRRDLVSVLMNVAHPALYRVLGPDLRDAIAANEMEAALLHHLDNPATRDNALSLADALFRPGYPMSQHGQLAIKAARRIDAAPAVEDFYVPDF